MPGGLPLGLEVCNGTSVGVSTASSNGTTLTPSATANTKGSYATLIAATVFDAAFAVVTLSNGAASNGSMAVDIAVGSSGNEVVIANNLFTYNNNLGDIATPYGFPIQIPAGTRIAARCQSSVSSDSNCFAQLTLFDGAFTQMEGAAGVDAIGFLTASTQGSAIDPGATINTKGTYTQLIAATVRDYMGLILMPDAQNVTAAGTSSTSLIDVAVGGSGSEQVIIPNFFAQRRDAGVITSPNPSPFYPIPIPKGTRIAARSQCSINTATYRLMGLTAYGIYA